VPCKVLPPLRKLYPQRLHVKRHNIGILYREVNNLICHLMHFLLAKNTFYGRRGSVVFPNVLNREFYAENPFQKLVTDITYIRVGDTFAYLSAVQDLYNNEIVAWELSERNDLEWVLNTLKQLDGNGLTRILFFIQIKDFNTRQNLMRNFKNSR